MVRAIQDRLRHRFNVAVAEIGFQDLWQRALISAVTVASDRKHAALLLQGVEDEAAAFLGAQLVATTVEWLE